MSADFEMGVGGFMVGALAGTMVTAGMAAGRAVTDIAVQQRNLGTIQSWATALNAQKLRAMRAERQVLRQSAEIQQLREALALATFELDCLRQC